MSLRACCKVVCRPMGTDQRRGRVVLVDEHRTSRVSSAVNGQQPCERQLNKRRVTRPADWKAPAGQVEQRLLRPACSLQRDQPVRGMMWCLVVAPPKPPQAPCSSQAATQAAASEPGPSTPLPAKQPAPQPGRWVDRDCNAALNMQRIGEAKWRPLELCYWPEQGKLPAKGKEYPELGYKRVRDKPAKGQQQQQQQQQQPAGAHHGIHNTLLTGLAALGGDIRPAIESIASLLAQYWVPLGMGAWGAKPQVPCDTRWASYISSTVSMLHVWAHARDAVSQLLERQKGASGSGQQVQGQGQAVKVVIGQRRQVMKAALRGLVKAALPDLSPAQVDAVVAEDNKRMTMGSKQFVLAASTPGRQRLHRAAEYRRGIDGRARNNA
ncbi:hypothetical protein QJQ45_027565 [Haematococcus lacustris]|nr:hypothetical protein QJQ45_027565 [Haematococcus lacustris]